ncbi:hypothetical protein BDN67DRAFT_1014805 [Paxillus ammoniavirescens]|nr:hypothetical protein BDN67DRAFT_1014805 [Paxillus ammoniavirescens]
MWKRWVAEAGARKQEAAQQEAAEREVAERERECMEEEEVARVREMVDQMATNEPLGEEQEGGEAHKRPFAEAFDKGTKKGEEVEANDVEGERVDAEAAWEESRGQPKQVVSNHVRQGADRCEACEERGHEAQREREVSVTSGASKRKTQAKGKGKACQAEPERATSGPSQVPGSSRPWIHPGMISSTATEVMGADLLSVASAWLAESQLQLMSA